MTDMTAREWAERQVDGQRRPVASMPDNQALCSLASDMSVISCATTAIALAVTEPKPGAEPTVENLRAMLEQVKAHSYETLADPLCICGHIEEAHSRRPCSRCGVIGLCLLCEQRSHIGCCHRFTPAIPEARGWLCPNCGHGEKVHRPDDDGAKCSMPGCDCPGLHVSVICSPDTPKKIREALCVAQTSMNLRQPPVWGSQIYVLQRLVDDIDRQRPLGGDGNDTGGPASSSPPDEPGKPFDTSGEPVKEPGDSVHVESLEARAERIAREHRVAEGFWGGGWGLQCQNQKCLWTKLLSSTPWLNPNQLRDWIGEQQRAHAAYVALRESTDEADRQWGEGFKVAVADAGFTRADMARVWNEGKLAALAWGYVGDVPVNPYGDAV